MTLPILSVVIPSRNEFPMVVSTLYSIWHSWEAGGGDSKEIEIIIVDNASDDNLYDKRATKGTTSYLEGRGAYWSRALRIVRFPIAGNHAARNIGANMALGKYLFFSDAHMAYRPGAFHHLMKTVDESGGIVHCPIAWMGAYPPFRPDGHSHGLGYSYTLKMGEEWKGTWSIHELSTEKWFYIPALGHCSLMVNKKQFMDFGGYQKIHRTYGGGEMYLNMKWWMLGSSVAVEPKAVGYHLASGRGYSYNHDDYIENVLGVTWALGIDDWRERSYINWLRTGGKKEIMDTIMTRSEKEHQKDREWIAKHRKMSFNELLISQPWSKLNVERFKDSKENIAEHSFLSVFHWTWIELLYKGLPEKNIKPAPRYVQELYENSQLQKDLADFIENKLEKYIYKGAEYKKKYGKEGLEKLKH